MRRLVCQGIRHGIDATVTCIVPEKHAQGTGIVWSSYRTSMLSVGRPVVVLLAGSVSVDTTVRVVSYLRPLRLSDSLSNNTFHLLRLMSV
jgi:hypothetical protein